MKFQETLQFYSKIEFRFDTMNIVFSRNFLVIKSFVNNIESKIMYALEELNFVSDFSCFKNQGIKGHNYGIFSKQRTIPSLNLDNQFV